MKFGRRDFLKQLAAFLGGAFAGLSAAGGAKAAGSASVATTAKATATTAAMAPYGANVRRQVFEVIVRQGLAGAPWKEICAGPMKVNSITEQEVAHEIARRRKLMDTDPAYWEQERLLRERQLELYKQEQKQKQKQNERTQ